MSGKMKLIIPIVILIGGALLMWLFISMGGDKSKRETKIQTKLVETELIRLSTIPARIKGYGRVTSAQPIQLYSEVSGTLMAGNIPFQPAQSFKKGDLLLKIDNRQTTLALNSLKSDLLTALATFLSEIKLNFPQEFDIWQDYFNDCDFDNELQELPPVNNQKIKLFLARFNVYKLYFGVRDLEIRLTKHYFYAPFDGSIVAANLRAGSTARIGTLLGEIINIEKLEVEVPISAADIQWMDINGPVKLSSSEISNVLTGQISRIGKTIDSRTQTVQLFISIDKISELSIIEGIFFEIEIQGLEIDQAVSIPQKALYNENYAYLIKNGKLVYRKVVVIRNENSSVIISGGLNDGDVLVVEPMQGVYENMPAKPKQKNSKAEVADE